MEPSTSKEPSDEVLADDEAPVEPVSSIAPIKKKRKKVKNKI